MNEKELLRKSGYCTVFVLFFVSLFWFFFYIQPCRAGYTGGPQSGIDVGINSRSTSQMNLQVSSSGVYVIRLGIENVTGLGTATGYMAGTNTYYPRIEWTPTLGTFNFVGTGSYPVTIQTNGVAIPSLGSVSGKIDAVGGTGTGNVLTNTTLAGQGTITATFNASGANISPIEVSYLDGMSENINNKFSTVSGSITNHTHTGSDGTTQVSHASLTSKGTQTHVQIDDFIASKAAASGVASLDANSLVVQNPASGTSTPGASKTVMSDGTGKIFDGWLSDNVTKLGTPTTSNIPEGSNLYYLDARVNAAIGSNSINVLNDVNITDWTDGYNLKIQSGQIISGSSSASVGFDSVTGSATTNTELSRWLGENKLLVSGTTTVYSSPGSATTLYSLTRSTSYVSDANTTLLLNCNNIGSSTFTDSSSFGYAVTSNGNAIGSSTVILVGGSGWLDGDGDFLTVVDNSGMPNGTNSFSIEKTFRLGTITGLIDFCNQTNNGSNYWSWYWNNSNNRIYFDSYTAGVGDMSFYATHTFTAGTTYKICVDRNGTTASDWKIFVDGNSKTLTLADGSYGGSIYAASSALSIGGRTDSTLELSGLIDGFRISNISRHQSNYTPATSEVNVNNIYTYNTLQVFPPGTTTAALQIKDNGTYTNSIITSIPGKLIVGSSTESGTTTVYIAEFDGAVKATVFNETSTKRVKENIENIKIKPDLLDAEAEAKHKYIADNKVSWFANNQANYIYVGTNTVTHIDDIAMEKDYAKYIELQWASDLNQDTYIQDIQKAHEKSYWKNFDAMSPKSWNPIGKPDIIHRGFIAEEIPSEVRGDDKKSVALCALIAYTVKSSQALKADTVFTLSTLKELIMTGTVTQQKINCIEDRLEVLNP